MTLPRRIIPGATTMVTCRTHDRRWRLVPVKVIRDLFEYTLARAAQIHGIDVHGYIVLSNHYHAICTDPRGVLPDFARDLNATMARALNTLQGRRDSLWTGGGVHYLHCSTPQDSLGKAAYVLLNAVEAGAVERRQHWPGAKSALDACLHDAKICRRPDFYFDPNSPKNPAEIPLKITPVPGFEADGAEGFVAKLRARVIADGARHRTRHAEWGWRCPSTRSIQRRSIDHKSATYEPFGQRTPTVAAKDRDTRIGELTELMRFRQRYQEARKALLSSPVGMVMFPYGTFALRTDPRVLIARA